MAARPRFIPGDRVKVGVQIAPFSLLRSVPVPAKPLETRPILGSVIAVDERLERLEILSDEPDERGKRLVIRHFDQIER